MNPVRNKVKVLIGTPVHVSKDYSMERWLANVSRLEYPADLLIVDNSPGLSYVKKIKGYCKKYGIKNYKIEHLDLPPLYGSAKDADEQIHERIVRSEEIIRKEFLSSDYDAWFFWESDVIIPANALGKLIQLMKAGDFMVVVHNCWVNNIPNQVNLHFGVTLFKRECLEKYSFLPAFGTDPDMSPSWYEAENWFRNRLHKDECNYIEAVGLIEPVYHLAK